MLFKDIKIVGIYLFIIVVGFIASLHFMSYNHDTQNDDVYYLWVEGKRILSKENPYEKILLDGVNRDQDKGYAIYFPLFYLLSALTQILGLKTYSTWIAFWQPVFLLFNIGIALLIFYILYRCKKTLFAIFSVLFWLFNRYTLHGYLASYVDFIPIFLLIFSLLIFRKNKWSSLFLFSFSLAIKHMGIFLVPLYLIWIWQSTDKNSIKEMLIALIIIMSIPVITSFPFILWNARGFFESILYSVTRPVYFFGTISLDGQLGLSGFSAKLPMLFLMSLIYIATIKKEVRMYMGVFLTMLIFVNFNSVLFIQHLCWVLPFVPLSICDFFYQRSSF